MRRPTGFTLIELLVVIAIIAILAGIVLPNVAGYISRARATRAMAELNGIDIAVTAMLADVNRSNFAGFFDNPPAPLNLRAADLMSLPPQDGIKKAIEIYTDAFYILLKRGKNADLSNVGGVSLILNNSVKGKLADSYMTDLGRDPWGNLYQFFAGPWRGGTADAMPFVIRDVTDPVPGGPEKSAYTVTDDPNTPDLNESTLAWAPSADQPLYVYSIGANLRSNQSFDEGYDGTADLGEDFVGGGDDVNNWDKGSSWSTFY
jgi:prepilin-type N-terminal cleavage/methylation domain-containing protein